MGGWGDGEREGRSLQHSIPLPLPLPLYVYGPLNLDAVVRVEPLKPNPDWQFAIALSAAS